MSLYQNSVNVTRELESLTVETAYVKPRSPGRSHTEIKAATIGVDAGLGDRRHLSSREFVTRARGHVGFLEF